MLAALAVVTYVVYRMARPVPGVGIATPMFIPPLVAALAAMLLNSQWAAPTAYVAGTLGTLIGVGALGQMLDAQGHFPEIERPMVVDALSCIFGSLVGTSTSGAYIESATGIREGARTGLAAVTTGLLFAVALFFLPLVEPLQQLASHALQARLVEGLVHRLVKQVVDGLFRLPEAGL